MRRMGKRWSEPTMATDTSGGAAKLKFVLAFGAAAAQPLTAAPTVSPAAALSASRRLIAVIAFPPSCTASCAAALQRNYHETSAMAARPGSMVVPRHGAAASAHQEVEVAAFVRLVDMLDIELHVAARGVLLRRRPLPAAPLELGIGHVQMQSTLFHVELDQIAALHQRERPAGGRFRHDVQHDGA